MHKTVVALLGGVIAIFLINAAWAESVEQESVPQIQRIFRFGIAAGALKDNSGFLVQAARLGRVDHSAPAASCISDFNRRIVPMPPPEQKTIGVRSPLACYRTGYQVAGACELGISRAAGISLLVQGCCGESGAVQYV